MSIIPIAGFSEPFASMSHLFATAPFSVWGIALLARAGGEKRWLWLLIFVVASLALLALSGVYHLLDPGGMGRVVLQRLDHAAIFVLIAATFTAAHGILFRGPWRWGMLLLVWALSALAITLKSIFFQSFSSSVGLAMYLALGWLGLVSGVVLVRRYGFHFIRWLLAGALAYSLGAVAEFLQTPVVLEGVIGPHEIFHVAVLAGLFCHWRFIWQFADGTLPLLRGLSATSRLSPAEIEARIRQLAPAGSPAARIEVIGGGRASLRLMHGAAPRQFAASALPAFADQAMYAVLFAELGHADVPNACEFDFRLLRAPSAADLMAEAELLKLGGGLALCSVRLRSSANGEVVAEASGRYLLSPEAPA